MNISITDRVATVTNLERILTRSSARVYVYVRVRDDHGTRPDRVAVR